MTMHEYNQYMANRDRIIRLNKIREYYDQPLLEVPTKIKCPKTIDSRQFESASLSLMSL